MEIGSGCELNVFHEALAEENRQELCGQCLRVIENCVGKPTRPYNATSGQMLQYVREVFGDVFDTATNLARESRGDSVRFQILVRIVQAEGIFGIGRTDTYCKVWVDERTKLVSATQKRTCTPRWDEEFLLDVQEPATSQLVIEVWKKDPNSIREAFSRLFHSDSVRSFFDSIHDLFASCFRPRNDEFVGRLCRLSREVPCVGNEEWHTMKNEAGQDSLTRIQVAIHFRSIPPAHFNVLNSIKGHFALSYLFLHHRVSRCARDALQWNKWEDCIDREGLTLLHQHSIYNNLQEVEKCYCYLLAVAEFRIKNYARINYAVAYLLFKELQLELQQARHQFISDSVARLIPAFAFHISVLLADFRQAFQLHDQRHNLDLSGVLSICTVMETIHPMHIIDSACNALRKNEEEWYRSLAQECSGMNDLSTVTFVLERIGSQQEKANMIFQQTWKETHTSITVDQLDVFFEQEVRSRVVRLCTAIHKSARENDELVEASLQMFTVIQAFVRKTLPFISSSRTNLRILRYREWFGAKVMVEWFTIASKCNKLVKVFVERDPLLPMNPNVKYGSSYKETVGAIHERFIKLWKLINWSNFSCALAFIDSIKKWVSLYAIKIEERVNTGFADESGDCVVSARLCVAINNLTAMMYYLQAIRSNILDSLVGTPQGLEQFIELDLKLQRATTCLASSEARVSNIVVQKIQPEIERHMSSVLQCENTVEQEIRVNLLQKHTMACVTALHSNLEAMAFKSVLRTLWKKVVLLLKQLMNKLQNWHFCTFQLNSVSFLGVSKMMERLPKCFVANDCGLSRAELNDDLSVLRNQLENLMRLFDIMTST
ncbi:BAI1-associated protein 3-like [Ornithodoros turicata]|uniref:BAI1-associated protein 3-like n=1 Tax=Ornithodoros turicata TaxID=34597 RepID=UPI003138DF05